MSNGNFKCAVCGETYEKERSDEEAAKEFEEKFGMKIDETDVDIVCDDCYRKMMNNEQLHMS